VADDPLNVSVKHRKGGDSPLKLDQRKIKAPRTAKKRVTGESGGVGGQQSMFVVGRQGQPGGERQKCHQ